MHINIQGKNKADDTQENYSFHLNAWRLKSSYTRALDAMKDMDARILDFLQKNPANNEYILNLLETVQFVSEQTHHSDYPKDVMVERVGVRLCEIISNNIDSPTVIQEELKQMLSEVELLYPISMDEGEPLQLAPTNEAPPLSFENTASDFFEPKPKLSFID